LDDTFEYIARFFEGSLQELSTRNPEITTAFKRVDANRFTAHVFRSGRLAAQCGIRLGGPLGAGIAYSMDPNATNSLNESLSVEDDGQSLLLRPMMGTAGQGGRQQLSQQGGAECFWEVLIRPLQQ
jgi:hypothetical protein